jgi:hypothetical protein
MERILNFAEFSQSFDKEGETLGNTEQDVKTLAASTDALAAHDGHAEAELPAEPTSFGEPAENHLAIDSFETFSSSQEETAPEEIPADAEVVVQVDTSEVGDSTDEEPLEDATIEDDEPIEDDEAEFEENFDMDVDDEETDETEEFPQEEETDEVTEDDEEEI